MIAIITAMSKNRVIGKDNWMPWHIPRDLQFVKQTTENETIIMGRKTFETFKRPLPNRENVILTTDKSYQPLGCQVIHSINTVLEWNKKNPEQFYFIFGGGEIYRQFLPYTERMYITYIDKEFSGDTYFPCFDLAEWQETSSHKGIKDDANPFDYYFIQYDRKQAEQ